MLQFRPSFNSFSSFLLQSRKQRIFSWNMSVIRLKAKKKEKRLKNQFSVLAGFRKLFLFFFVSNCVLHRKRNKKSQSRKLLSSLFQGHLFLLPDALAASRWRIISNFNFRRRRWTNQQDYMCISDKKESKEKRIWSAEKVTQCGPVNWEVYEKNLIERRTSQDKMSGKGCKIRSESYKERL